jgi:hypothetical protein
MNELVAEARKGRQLFLDATALGEADTAAFSLVSSHFRMLQKAPAFYQLEPL